VNRGGLCLKGWSSAALLGHPDRLRAPLMRRDDGSFETVTWAAALSEIASRFRLLRARCGPDTIGVFGGGSLTNEAAYMLGKLARLALGTANIDYNGRFCMSSAAAAQNRAFGIDRGLPFPLEDLPQADVILLVGANPAETMPPIMQYFEAQQRRGGALFVVDPRRSATAAWATGHLPIRPGTDAALANGLLHVLVRDGLVRRPFVDERTEGFDEARRVANAYWPGRVEALTGIPEAMVVEVAHRLAAADAAMILSARGSEQQAQGVNNVLAYINVALALGLPGRPYSGFGSLTGQGNGQGGREHGQKSDQLPGYRSILDPEARRHVAAVWGVDERQLPRGGKPACELIEALGDEVRGLLVIGSNPVVSAPDARLVEARLARLDTLVVCDFFLSETAALAHVVLPAAQWAEQDGTVTNLEGRVIRRRKACSPAGLARTDLEIITSIATALGHPAGFVGMTPQAAFEELCRASSGGPADYAGISYDRLDWQDGVFWPCPAVDHPGSARLFAEQFPTRTGRARFHPTPHAPVADERDADFPLLLTTGRVLAQYQSGTQTRRVDALNAVAPEPLAEMHPAVAARIGVRDGDPVRLSTRRGDAIFTAKVTRTIREDTIFVPFHWGGPLAINRLTNAATDPVRRMPGFKVCAVRCSPEPSGSRPSAGSGT
jgi:assimilatory nitrate reductase catalytic subunit